MATPPRKSRSKGLPPKVQLRTKDSLAASYPTGRGYVSYYDDMRTVVFKSYANATPGIPGDPHGLNPNNNYDNVGYSSEGLLAWYPMQHDLIVTGSTVAFNSGVVFFGPQAPDLSAVWDITFGPNPQINIADPQYVGGDVYFSTKSDFIIAFTGGEGRQLAKNPTDAFDFSPNNPFTVSAHVNFGSFDSNYNPVIWRGIPASSFADWEIMVSNDGRLFAAVFDNSTGDHLVYKTDKDVIPTNIGDTTIWAHIVVTFDGTSTFQMYVDGVLQTLFLDVDTGWANFASSPAGAVYVGELKDLDYVGGTRRTNFHINQITIFSRVITAAEVEVLRTGDVSADAPPGPNTGTLNLGSGLPVDSMFITDEITTDINVDAPLRKGVGDAWIDPLVETFAPFRDSDNAAVDGKSTNNAFYATGSLVGLIGEGFDQPLWSKTRVEIDLTPTNTHSFWIQAMGSGTVPNNVNYPMAYWNHETRQYEGIGRGIDFSVYSGTQTGSMVQLFEDQPIGFGASLDNGGFSTGLFSSSYIIGGPITNFGFPIHAKFAGTSSNLIGMSSYISRPFLVEKMVLYFSGSLKLNNYYQPNSNLNMTTFFLLNQRRPYVTVPSVVSQIITYYSASDFVSHQFITGCVLPTTYNGRYVDSVREMIGYFQASNGTTGFGPVVDAGLQREYALAGGSRWSHQMAMSSSARSPIQTPAILTVGTSGNLATFSQGPVYVEKYNFSGRKGVPEANGRDYINAFESFQKFATGSLFTYFGIEVRFDTSLTTTKYNPYLLFPQDNLIFGIALPYSRDGFAARGGGSNVYGANGGKGPEMEVGPTGIHKLVLYGSYINQDSETHEDVITELTSLAAHEVIG